MRNPTRWRRSRSTISSSPSSPSSSAGPDDERFVPKMTVLMENVRHHVKEEERDLFKQMRASMSKGDLTDLGTALRGARKTAPKRPHPHASDTPPGNLVATAITAPLDAALAIGETAANAVRSRGRS